MRSSAILAIAALTGYVLASPIHNNAIEKRLFVTDVTTEYVTVFVTEGQIPTSKVIQHISTKKPTTSATPTPSPIKPVVNVVTPGVFVATVAPTPTPTPAPVVVETPVVVDTPAASPAAASPAAASSPGSSDPYKAAVLNHHNVHRANHTGSGDLTYDDNLASYAATVAARCVFAHDITLGGGGYGQNIADSGSTGDEKSKNPADLVSGVVSDMWYNGELSHFLPSYYGQPSPDMSNFENWGHFSQVVWKGTTTVGCATQFCASGDGSIFTGDYSGWFTVCNYGPAGNVGGGYAANIGTLKGNPTVSV